MGAGGVTPGCRGQMQTGLAGMGNGNWRRYPQMGDHQLGVMQWGEETFAKNWWDSAKTSPGQRSDFLQSPNCTAENVEVTKP